MRQMFKNWKTTLFGFTTLLTGIKLILTGHQLEGISAIASGLGLHFAKDIQEEK